MNGSINLHKWVEYILYLFLASLAIDGYLILNYGLGLSHFVYSALLLLSFIVYNGHLKVNSEIKFLAAVIFVLFLTFPFIVDSTVFVQRFSTLVYYLVIYITISQIKSVNIKKVFYVYSLILLFICIYTYMSLNMSFLRMRFSYHIDYNPSWLAAHLVGVIFLAYPSFKISGIRQKIVTIFIVILSLFFLFITQGRTSLFALILAIILMPAYHFRMNNSSWVKKSSKYLIYLFFVIFVIFLFVSIYSSEIIEWLSLNGHRIIGTFETTESDEATAGRTSIWVTYIQSFLSNPLPVGLGMSSLVIGRASHNNYLLLLSEGSLIALVLWILFHIKLFNVSRNNFERFIAIFFLIFSIGNDMLHYKYYWLLLYIFVIIRKSNYAYK